MAKPIIFIASSGKSSKIAHQIKDALIALEVGTISVWDEEGMFPPGEFFLDSIREFLRDHADFGIFIFAPDDDVLVKGDKLKVTRDNVVLELGMCIGVLERKRSIVLAPSNTSRLRIPSDIWGVHFVRYDTPRTDSNAEDGLASACRVISNHIAAHGFFPRTPNGVRTLNGPIPKDRRNDDDLLMITDAKQLLSLYEDERPIRDDLPYSAIKTWEVDLSASAPEIKVQVKYGGDFSLKYESVSHKLFQVQAYAQRVAWGQIKSDESMVRLVNWTHTHKTGMDIMKIQRAKYSDQVQSNLALHWPTQHENWEGKHGLAEPFLLSQDTEPSYPTLSVLLSTLQPGTRRKRLPPFGHAAYDYLANTIGVSIILFYKKETSWLPIVRDRSDDSTRAVFDRGWHVSVSFALRFTPDTEKAATLHDLIYPQLVARIKEEALIKEGELGILTPLALCREFMRGGKPQLFYAGYIKDLEESDIAQLFRGAGRRIRFYDTPQQVDDELSRSSLMRPHYTTEFAANWFYCSDRYLPKLFSFTL